MQEDVLMFFFDHLVRVTFLSQVGVVIITILKALVLDADEKPENNTYTRFYTDISSFQLLEF